MLRRPQDVLNNLKNFALSVVRTLQEMASKVLANQIFNSLLSIGASLIGGAPPGNAGGMDLRGFHLFNGGLVGRAEGGLVTEGVPNRSEERRVGKDVSVRVDLGGRRIVKKQIT